MFQFATALVPPRAHRAHRSRWFSSNCGLG
jgi:hypothetical protein